MYVARKAETEHEHYKDCILFHNYAMKSGAVVDISEGLPTKDDLVRQEAMGSADQHVGTVAATVRKCKGCPHHYLGDHPE